MNWKLWHKNYARNAQEESTSVNNYFLVIVSTWKLHMVHFQQFCVCLWWSRCWWSQDMHWVFSIYWAKHQITGFEFALEDFSVFGKQHKETLSASYTLCNICADLAGRNRALRQRKWLDFLQLKFCTILRAIACKNKVGEIGIINLLDFFLFLVIDMVIKKGKFLRFLWHFMVMLQDYPFW